MRHAAAGFALLTLVIAAALLPRAFHGGAAPAPRPGPALRPGADVRIQLNGTLLARGRLLRRSPGDAAVYVSVRDLAAAIDGREAAEPSRLRASGSRLDAVAAGGCGGCALRVVRPVRISGAVRRMDGEAYVPLVDLVRALEGRLEADARPGSYGIFVGACAWCVLEPGGPRR